MLRKHMRLDADKVHAKGSPILASDTLYIMHGEEVVHVGNLNTIEEFVLSLF